jgi:hypothetical protein
VALEKSYGGVCAGIPRTSKTLRVSGLTLTNFDAFALENPAKNLDLKILVCYNTAITLFWKRKIRRRDAADNPAGIGLLWLPRSRIGPAAAI